MCGRVFGVCGTNQGREPRFHQQKVQEYSVDFCLSAPKSQLFLRLAIAMPIVDPRNRKRFLTEDKAMVHCDLRVRWKVASDLRFQAAILSLKPFLMFANFVREPGFNLSSPTSFREKTSEFRRKWGLSTFSSLTRFYHVMIVPVLNSVQGLPWIWRGPFLGQGKRAKHFHAKLAPFLEPKSALSGHVLRDTARLSQRYPPIARYGVFGVSTWPLGCDTPSPFSERFPLGEHAEWRCDTPPQKRYLSDTCAIPYENKANGCDTPLCDTISKGYCAI